LFGKKKNYRKLSVLTSIFYRIENTHCDFGHLQFNVFVYFFKAHPTKEMDRVMTKIMTLIVDGMVVTAVVTM
jgi:hypothetical protein